MSYITSKFLGFRHLLQQVYTLVRPYGRRRLVKVFLVSLTQALAQVVSVAAVFPFLSLAADPMQFEQSKAGQLIGMLLPGISQQQALMTTGIFLILALFMANGVSLYGEFYRAKFTWGYAHWLRMRMLSHMSSKPYGWFIQQNSSILIKKVTQDILQFVNGVLSPIIDALTRLLIMSLILGAIMVAEPQIALNLAAVLGITYVLIFTWLGKFRDYLSDTLKVHWRGVYQKSGQLLTGIKPVKVHGVEKNFLSQIEVHSKAQSQLQAWMPVIGSGPRYLIEPLIAATMIIMVLQLLISGQDPAQMVPSLGLITMAGYRLLPAIQIFYAQLTSIQSMRFGLEEVYEEFREVEVDRKKNSMSGLANKAKFVKSELIQFQSEISLKEVCFRYSDSKNNVLENISLTIPKNTSIAFIGETGCGKSTLIDLILGLHRPTSGQLLIDGKPLESENNIRAWQRLVGYVPQDIFLADDTIARNIAFGIPDEEIDNDRLHQVAGMAQIGQFIAEDLPDGYKTEVGERGVRLSGGQRQRIALARALYHRPEILLLDEATSALDKETEKRFMDTIYGLAGGITLIMVAHRIGTIEHVNCRFVVADGTVSLSGTT